MRRASEERVAWLPPQHGNVGHHLVPKGVFKDLPLRPQTDLDRMTAAAKRIVAEDALLRSEKTARLNAARKARDDAAAVMPPKPRSK